eukprot:scaffold7637_cov430-Prasinococcus_capsulatus_cf.AAC.8
MRCPLAHAAPLRLCRARLVELTCRLVPASWWCKIFSVRRPGLRRYICPGLTQRPLDSAQAACAMALPAPLAGSVPVARGGAPGPRSRTALADSGTPSAVRKLSFGMQSQHRRHGGPRPTEDYEQAPSTAEDEGTSEEEETDTDDEPLTAVSRPQTTRVDMARPARGASGPVLKRSGSSFKRMVAYSKKRLQNLTKTSGRGPERAPPGTLNSPQTQPGRGVAEPSSRRTSFAEPEQPQLSTRALQVALDTDKAHFDVTSFLTKYAAQAPEGLMGLRKRLLELQQTSQREQYQLVHEHQQLLTTLSGAIASGCFGFLRGL